MAILYDTVDFKYSCRNIHHTEALRTQMEVRRRLNEQLEVIQNEKKIFKTNSFYSTVSISSEDQRELFYILGPLHICVVEKGTETPPDED